MTTVRGWRCQSICSSTGSTNGSARSNLGTAVTVELSMEKLLQDLRFALRSLGRQPGFALTAVMTLALGIGATTAIFSVVNAVMLRPLPFERADRIVALQNFWTERATLAQSVSAPDFHDWKAQSTSFESMGYYAGG